MNHILDFLQKEGEKKKRKTQSTRVTMWTAHAVKHLEVFKAENIGLLRDEERHL